MNVEHVCVCVFVFLFVCFQDSNYLTKERVSFAVNEATLCIPTQQINTIKPSLHYSHIVHAVHLNFVVLPASISR